MAPSLTPDLVHILQWQAQGLVCGASRGEDRVQSLKQGHATCIPFLALHFPALEPWHLSREEKAPMDHGTTYGFPLLGPCGQAFGQEDFQESGEGSCLRASMMAPRLPDAQLFQLNCFVSLHVLNNSPLTPLLMFPTSRMSSA